MHGSINRRRFFTDAARAAAGAIAGGYATTRVRTCEAIEPVVRQSGPKFKFSLAAYSYRNLLTGDPAELTTSDFIADCAKMGLDGTELTSYYFPDEPRTTYLNDLKHLAHRLGLDISGTAVRNDFCYPPGEKRQREIDHVKHWVDYAAALRAPVIRIFSGTAREGQSVEDAQRLAVEAIEETCTYAGSEGIFLALENHGGLTTSIDGILALVRDVQSPWFGVNLDTGNFRSSDPYGDLARLAPYAINVQVKVTIQPDGGAKQPADFGRLASILRDVGYRGYIVLEYEESADPRVACPRYVERLREAFG